ncbi:glycosyltransferase family 32 protein [Chromobacterium sp. ATCC 53434]|uniref:glycosyltransferase family 32 protein n=1 Tax=Chromobacterium sp. (strain ATCC 53434 / SC 14030) TaxID=2059672 RepID=UPI0013051DFD|nr:glycosyltransferase [Chromobacterium sp. ATCC 53434]
MNDIIIEQSAGIPRRVHQIWYQGAAALPDKYRRYRDGWMRNHPDWEFTLWDAAMLQALVDEHYPWFAARYAAFERDIQRIDASRYLFLALHGGFYIDMDIESLRPIDPLLPERSLILSRTHGFNNALIGSAPGHPLWATVHANLAAGRSAPLDPTLPARLRDSPAMRTAVTVGPRFFTMCVEESGCLALPSTLPCPGYYFEPGSPTPDGRSQPPRGDRSYARHDMDLNWLDARHRILSRINRLLLPLVSRLLPQR